MGHRQEGRLLIRVAALLLPSALVLMLLPAVAAQPAHPGLSGVKVVAVAPFADDVGMQGQLARWAAVRLTQLLPTPAFHVVSFDQAERTLREMRVNPADLTSLASAVELGRRLGANAVITGRLTRVDLDPPPRILFPLPPAQPPEGPAEAFVILDLQMAIVATRQMILHTETTGRAIGMFALQHATEMALRDYIRLLIGAQ